MRRWAPGIANEAWKVAICARDAAEADRAIKFLYAVLIGDGEVKLDELRKLSGDQIVNGIIAYQASSLVAIENGIKRS